MQGSQSKEVNEVKVRIKCKGDVTEQRMTPAGVRYVDNGHIKFVNVVDDSGFTTSYRISDLEILEVTQIPSVTRMRFTDAQFDGLDRDFRRSLMEQAMIVRTPKYLYSLGAKGNLWVLNRYDREESTGTDKWNDDYAPEIVDTWK